MTDAWCEAILKGQDYLGIYTRLPANIDIIIYNGDYVLKYLLAEKHTDAVDEIKDAIEAFFPINLKHVIVYSKAPSAYCRFNHRQTPSIYNPGTELHQKIVTAFDSTAGDFISKIDKFIDETTKNIVIFDKSDMTLLSLLHKEKYANIYMTYDDNLRKGISVSQLSDKLKQLSGNYTYNGYQDMLFVLPLTLLTGIPNIVSMQISCRHSRIVDLLNLLKEARGRIFDSEDLFVYTEPFYRFMQAVASKEVEYTAEFMPILHSDKRYKPYDPRTSGIVAYAEAYYTSDNFIMNNASLIKLIGCYLSALIEMYKYLRGDTEYLEHSFRESPLVHDIVNILKRSIDTPYIKATPVKHMAEITERNLNRIPPLI